MECDFPRTRKRRADKKRVHVRAAGSLEDGNTEGDPSAVIPCGFKRKYAGRIESVRRKNLPGPFHPHIVQYLDASHGPTVAVIAPAHHAGEERPGPVRLHIRTGLPGDRDREIVNPDRRPVHPASFIPRASGEK
jgi:hypothetical protein